MSATIIPYLFEFDLEPHQDKPLFCYVMPARAYETIKSAQLKPAHHDLDLRGLEPVLAWAAPCVDQYEIRRIDISNPGRTLHFWIYAPERSIEVVKSEVMNALSLWLGLILTPEQSESVLSILNDERSAKAAWQTLSIDSTLATLGACPVPKDGRLFDLVTVMASRALEGRVLDNRGGLERILLPTGPANSLYTGKSLLGYTPIPVESKNGEVRGYWTEVFKVAALTTPEQSRLRVAVSASIRNYLPIHPASFKPGGARSLDVFLTPDAFFTGGSQRVRVLPISLRRSDLQVLIDKSQTASSPSISVLRRIMALTGVEESRLLTSKGLVPVIDRKMSLYPRAGSYHGDKWLPGETGIGAPERKAYFDFLEEPLGLAGFKPVALERRRLASVGAFTNIAKDSEPERVLQELLLKQAQTLDRTDTIHLVFLSQRLTAIQDLKAALDILLGKPHASDGTQLTYASGLKIAIHALPTGPFGTKLDDPKATTQSTPTTLSPSRKIQIEREATRVSIDRKRLELESHISSSFHKTPGIWLALIEMDEKLRDTPARDPYILVYEMLARQDVLAQVVLIDPERSLENAPEKEDAQTHKLRSSLRDLFRAYGVVYIQPDSVPTDTGLQAWWVINFNSKRFDQQPGARKEKLVVPLAVEYASGQLMACFPDRSGASSWRPYARAVLALYAGEHHDTSDLREDQLKAYVGQFFGALGIAAEKRHCFCDATNIRRYIPSLGNGSLKFGELTMGGVGGAASSATLRDGGSNTVVRLLTDADKSPTYLVTENKTGITSGVFSESESSRTFWLSRGLPTPLQTSTAIQRANQRSRYPSSEEGSNLKSRRFPSLTEICVVILGQNEEAESAVALTRRAMELHASTDESTILPFPLHEACLLGESLR